ARVWLTLASSLCVWIAIGSSWANAQWWTQDAKPGEAEKNLERFVGNYQATMTLWSGPGAEPEVIKGTSVHKMILGGWILQVRDEYPGMSFSFIGYHFYDRAKAKYVNIGMSNKMGWLGGWDGQFDEEGRVLTYRETIVDPETGEKVNRKGVARLSENGYTYENFRARPGSRERRSRRIVYERR
ncbi:MAG: DUF1579 family protein, partial [Bacteroidota bacterium]